jgi:hypothetical protein
VNVALQLCDFAGSEVFASAKGIQSSGNHSLKIETATLPPGVYILKFIQGPDVISRKIIILK